jgi:hypothetical protein
MPTPLDFSGFPQSAFATYGCDTFGNDSDGNRVWENKSESLDLILGDGETASTFPAFVSNTDHDVEYYTFDGVDDYVSNWPTLPSAYTVCASFSDSYPDGHPYVTQCNDSTIEDLLTVSGAFTGNLHGILIFGWTLSELESNFVEQVMLRRVWRDTFVDPFTSRLIRSGDCKLAMYFEEESDRFVDYANALGSTDYSSVWDNGLTFPISNAAVEMDASGDLNLDELTIFLEASDFAENCLTSNTIVENGTNYSLEISNGNSDKFFGQDESGTPSTLNHDFHIYSTFDCAVDGYITHIRVYDNGANEIKPSLFLKSGSSYTRLWCDDTGVSIVSGWNMIALDSPVQVVAGEKYAISLNAYASISRIIGSGMVSGYKAATYSTFAAPASFDPTADGYTQKTDFNLVVEAYGYSADNTDCIVSIGGADYSFVKSNNRTIGVSVVDGEKPLIYLDGEYSGQGDSVATISSGGGSTFHIGNNSTRSNPFASTLKKLSVYSAILSPDEIRAAHRMAIAGRPFS